MNAKKARLLRQFAKKHQLRLRAVKDTYLALPWNKREEFSKQLSSLA
jgi:hypothetical protein